MIVLAIHIEMNKDMHFFFFIRFLIHEMLEKFYNEIFELY